MMLDGRELKLTVRRVDSLHPHEETSEQLLASLKDRMANEWMQRDPIIVDEQNKVILDGMHRFEALKSLGVHLVVCFDVDYANEEIRLFRWLRYLRRPKRGLLEEIRNGLGLSAETSEDGATEAANSGDSPVAVLSDARGYFAPRSKVAGSESVRAFDRIVQHAKEEVEIVEEKVGFDRVRSGGILLVTRPLTKEGVVRAALDGRLFPHKTTLHVLPMRVMGINFPLADLNEMARAESALAKQMSSPRVSILEPPTNYEGRVYGERVVVLQK